LSEQHPKTIGVVPAEGFFDALPVVLQISDLILAILNTDALWHLCARLNDAGNFVQDR